MAVFRVEYCSTVGITCYVSICSLGHVIKVPFQCFIDTASSLVVDAQLNSSETVFQAAIQAPTPSHNSIEIQHRTFRRTRDSSSLSHRHVTESKYTDRGMQTPAITSRDPCDSIDQTN